jgi:hypothetical protein
MKETGSLLSFLNDIKGCRIVCQNLDDGARVEKTRFHSSIRSQASSVSLWRPAASASVMVPRAAQRNAAFFAGSVGVLVAVVQFVGCEIRKIFRRFQQWMHISC